MPEVDFSVLSAEAARHAATPTLNLRLAVSRRDAGAALRNIALHCQVRIDSRRRRYSPREQARLVELFGTADRWSQTLNSILWTHTQVMVPAFDGACTVELPVACSFDFNVAATKYFHGLEHGTVPLLLLFSGSLYYRGDDGALTMALIAHDKEARYELPVRVWQDMMQRYYPNCAWLCLDRRVFEALYDYKRRHGLTGFDQAVSSLLAANGAAVSA